MPITSLYPDLPLVETDLFTFLFNRPSRPYPTTQTIFQSATDLSKTYTYNTLRQTSIDFGKGLKSIFDFRKGSVLALFSPNDIDIPPVIFGTLWTGGLVSPANPGYTASEFAYQLKDSHADVVAVHYSVLDVARKACNEVGIPESNIILLGTEKDLTYKFKHFSSIRVTSGTSRYRAAKINPRDDLAFLVYSSGTTGKPKGVELTHHNLTSNVQQVQESEGGWLTWDGSKKGCPGGVPDAPPGGKADKILACLPFFHIYGLNCLILNPVYTGVHTLVMGRFEIEEWCRLVQSQQVTFSYIVPPMVVLLCKHPAVTKYDLGSLRMTNSGAAPLSKEMVEGLFKRTGVRVKQGYGLSETSPTIFQMRWQDWRNVGSTGRMVPNLLSKICEVGSEEEAGAGKMKELGTGETGELYVKGPNVFKRYHNNEKATRDCLDVEGWFRTGDVGFIDKQGELWITDRVKELIKYKGFQVAPAELEGYLGDHELVDDVAVVGVDSKELGTEVPRAYIVRKGGMEKVQKGDEEVIVNWLNAKVANHKKLRGGVRFVESVPKSVSGKILRRVLRDEARKEYAAMEDGKLKAKL